MVLIQNLTAFIAAAGFTAAGIAFGYFLVKSKGYGDFSVDISLLDLYAIILVLVPLTAGCSYLMMSLGLGSVFVGSVQIEWLRYFEWAVTTPILIAGVTVLTLDKKLTLSAMILDFFMINTGFLAVLLPNPWKTALFLISNGILLGLGYLLFAPSTRKVSGRPEVIRRLFTDLRNLIIGLWLLYPLIWLPSNEGFGLITAEQSFAAFTALDLASKIGYAFLVLRNLETVNNTEKL